MACRRSGINAQGVVKIQRSEVACSFMRSKFDERLRQCMLIVRCFKGAAHCSTRDCVNPKVSEIKFTSLGPIARSC